MEKNNTPKAGKTEKNAKNTATSTKKTTKKKKKVSQERFLKRFKMEPLIKKLMEIESDKLELIKIIVNYDVRS